MTVQSLFPDFLIREVSEDHSHESGRYDVDYIELEARIILSEINKIKSNKERKINRKHIYINLLKKEILDNWIIQKK
jgi:hypothetical protein